MSGKGRGTAPIIARGASSPAPANMRRGTPKSVKMLRKFSQLLFGADEWKPPVPILGDDDEVEGWIMERRLE